jgi:hypothetical protein
MSCVKNTKIKSTKIITSILISLFLLSTSIGLVSGDDDPNENIKDDDPGDASSKMKKDKAKNAGAHGKSTFLTVEGYKHWVVKVNKAKDKNGIDLITVEYDADTRKLTITAKDANSTNNVNILINKNFIEDLITDDPENLQFDLSEAVNYEGMNSSNASNGNGAVYVFHIKHFSTQFIEISPLVFLSTAGYVAIGIGGILIFIAAIFLFRKDKRGW